MTDPNSNHHLQPLQPAPLGPSMLDQIAAARRRHEIATIDDARAVLAARGLDHATVQVEPPGCADDCPGQTDW